MVRWSGGPVVRWSGVCCGVALVTVDFFCSDNGSDSGSDNLTVSEWQQYRVEGKRQSSIMRAKRTHEHNGCRTRRSRN